MAHWWVNVSFLARAAELFVPNWSLPSRADGAWALEAPAQVADIKLIVSGKFVEASKPLKGKRGRWQDEAALPISDMGCFLRLQNIAKKWEKSRPTRL